ncbi:SPRY domain-containing protein 4 [Clarias gariepinus]|uniref:SPRY domain-containing protein 4 n=1 Tax=Clarias gariepinus TaxID=13013 RepID=UPI00234D6A4F|nr:SPRY domain-containing protein 4 [Clarias gariepinus]
MWNKMALSSRLFLCSRFGRTAGALLLINKQPTVPLNCRCYVDVSKRNHLQFKLDERTAHSSLDLFKKDTGVIYRMLGLDPSHVQDSPLRFCDWAVVFADNHVDSGRHYWEVTVKKSQEFRIGVAEVAMSRDECIGTNSSSWVFSYVHNKWYAMTTNKQVPVSLVGKPDRVGLLLDYEAGKLGLVDPQVAKVVHTIKTHFPSPICPAFGLWDGEILTHSGLEVPSGLN